MFDLSLKGHLVETEVSGNDERFLVDEEAFERFLFNLGEYLFVQLDVFIDLDYFYRLVVPIEEFVSIKVNTLDVSHRGKVFGKFLLVVVIYDLNQF